MFSSSAKKGSSTSVLSERHSPYQYGRRCSNISIRSNRSSGTDIERKMVFSPIRIHDEEGSISQYEITSTNELRPSKQIKAVAERDRNDEMSRLESEATENCIKLECLENKESDVDQDRDDETNFWSAKDMRLPEDQELR